MKNSLSTIALAGCLAVSSAAYATTFDPTNAQELANAAADAIGTMGQDAAIAFMSDEANGFVELAGPGRHVWAIGRDGKIVFDLSGQTAPGLDVSSFLGPTGAPVSDDAFESVSGGNAVMYMELPHPVTNAMGRLVYACAASPEDADIAVCAGEW